MENNEVQEVSSSVLPENGVPEDHTEETEQLNETLSEIKEILLETSETSSDDSISIQEVPFSSITEEEFIKFNNNFCVGLTCLVLVCGIICGSVVALVFKGIFKD